MKINSRWKWICFDDDGSVWIFNRKPTFKKGTWSLPGSGDQEEICICFLDTGNYLLLEAKDSLREIVDGEVVFEAPIPKDTLVKSINSRSLYHYSHKENGIHYVFRDGCSSRTAEGRYGKNDAVMSLAKGVEVVTNED